MGLFIRHNVNSNKASIDKHAHIFKGVNTIMFEIKQEKE